MTATTTTAAAGRGGRRRRRRENAIAEVGIPHEAVLAGWILIHTPAATAVAIESIAGAAGLRVGAEVR